MCKLFKQNQTPMVESGCLRGRGEKGALYNFFLQWKVIPPYFIMFFGHQATAEGTLSYSVAHWVTVEGSLSCLSTTLFINNKMCSNYNVQPVSKKIKTVFIKMTQSCQDILMFTSLRERYVWKPISVS